MRRIFLLPLLSLAGCGEAVDDNHFADDIQQERAESPPVETQAVAVRIGELGANFPACNGAGTTRNLETGGSLAVRAAPFDTAEEIGKVPAGSRFFVCTRSHDQKWFGIVYAEGGQGQSCGVSAPVASRRAYDGPCRAGWVSSPFVKLTARVNSAQQLDSATEIGDNLQSK